MKEIKMKLKKDHHNVVVIAVKNGFRAGSVDNVDNVTVGVTLEEALQRMDNFGDPRPVNVIKWDGIAKFPAWVDDVFSEMHMGAASIPGLTVEIHGNSRVDVESKLSVAITAAVAERPGLLARAYQGTPRVVDVLPPALDPAPKAAKVETEADLEEQATRFSLGTFPYNGDGHIKACLDRMDSGHWRILGAPVHADGRTEGEGTRPDGR